MQYSLNFKSSLETLSSELYADRSLKLLSQLELGAEILRSQRKTVKSLRFSGKVLRGPGDWALGLGCRFRVGFRLWGLGFRV